ncbi:glucosaminidase domain-containing protein [Cohnella hongkongensis]|uniref:Glucosaminidase domain-containing protein n=1 Tax=Cohnella hongkongensis TaxID=178337 RepID=A0ABV9FJN0_9BACL
MRRETIRKWVAYLVIAAWTTTAGISCLATNANRTDANTSLAAPALNWPVGSRGAFPFPAAAETKEPEPAFEAAGDESQAGIRPTSFETAAVLERFQTAAAPAAMQEIAKNPDQEVHIASPVQPRTQLYEVTAYYLNVRVNGYSKSKIKTVVEKGTRLEIVSRTAEGWLRIKGGGYVHGDYAKPVSEEREAAAAAEVTASQTETALQTETASQAEPPAADMQAAAWAEEEKPPAPGQPTSKVETESGLTEEDIALIFKGTELAGHGLEETILEVEEKYGINALFTIAVMKLESGNGSSRLAKSKNNLFGLNATGPDPHRKAFAFETKGDSVKKFGQLLADKYVGKGYTTIEKIGTKYCPANSKWPSLVKNIMKRDYKKLNVI